jgi:HD-GYP domain-containing protein (c-di-GMP phosphodiesterase class II)
MLVKVKPEEVTLGMYIQGFEGGWLNHPFWRSKFLLTDAGDLEAVRSSGVAAVLVDASLSTSPPTPANDASPSATAEPPPATQPVQPPAPRPRVGPATFGKRKAPPAFPNAPAACSAAEEFGRASEVIGHAKQEVRRIYHDARFGTLEVDDVAPVVESITASLTRNGSSLISMARLKEKDEYTYLHSVAVSALMVNLAKHLGLSPEEQHQAGVAGLMLDIGKSMVPPEILAKPGELSAAEMAVVRTHVEKGHAALLAGNQMPAIALDVCLEHHERFDGSGYPMGKKGEEISLYARMGAICDVYDAITSDRPYRAAIPAADGIARMFKWEGRFDRNILNAFIRSVGIYPVGSLVRLASGRIALVTDQNPDSLTRPRVRAFYAADGSLIPPVDIDLAIVRDEQITGRADEAKRDGGAPLGEWSRLVTSRAA